MDPRLKPLIDNLNKIKKIDKDIINSMDNFRSDKVDLDSSYGRLNRSLKGFGILEKLKGTFENIMIPKNYPTFNLEKISQSLQSLSAFNISEVIKTFTNNKKVTAVIALSEAISDLIFDTLGMLHKGRQELYKSLSSSNSFLNSNKDKYDKYISYLYGLNTATPESKDETLSFISSYVKEGANISDFLDSYYSNLEEKTLTNLSRLTIPYNLMKVSMQDLGSLFGRLDFNLYRANKSDRKFVNNYLSLMKDLHVPFDKFSSDIDSLIFKQSLYGNAINSTLNLIKIMKDLSNSSFSTLENSKSFLNMGKDEDLLSSSIIKYLNTKSKFGVNLINKLQNRLEHNFDYVEKNSVEFSNLKEIQKTLTSLKSGSILNSNDLVILNSYLSDVEKSILNIKMLSDNFNYSDISSVASNLDLDPRLLNYFSNENNIKDLTYLIDGEDSEENIFGDRNLDLSLDVTKNSLSLEDNLSKIVTQFRFNNLYPIINEIDLKAKELFFKLKNLNRKNYGESIYTSEELKDAFDNGIIYKKNDKLNLKNNYEIQAYLSGDTDIKGNFYNKDVELSFLKKNPTLEMDKARANFFSDKDSKIIKRQTLVDQNLLPGKVSEKLLKMDSDLNSISNTKNNISVNSKHYYKEQIKNYYENDPYPYLDRPKTNEVLVKKIPKVVIKK